MFQRILVPLDGSERAERAIPLAGRLARSSGGTLIFLYVVPPSHPLGIYSGVQRQERLQEFAQAEDYLKQDVARAYASVLAGLEIERKVIPGEPAMTIFSVAALNAVDLIVMCSHGDRGLKRWVFGSVAQDAVQQSPVPLLVLNEHGSDTPFATSYQPLGVIVPLDGSALAEEALEPAAHLISTLAFPGPALLHLLRIVDIPATSGKFKVPVNVDAVIREERRQEAMAYLVPLVARLQQRFRSQMNLTVTSSVEVGEEAAAAIVEVSRQLGGERQNGQMHLLALATHGRSGWQRLLMGSVAEQVIGATTLPILIVRPAQSEEQMRPATPAPEASETQTASSTS